MSTCPQFLVIEVPDLVAARKAFAELARRAADSGGHVLVAALPREVQVLEPGTRLAAVLVVRWDTAEQLNGWWCDPATTAAFAWVATVDGSRAVSVRGLPETGLPGEFLPTVATVEVPKVDGPPAYMLVQGSVTDLDPIEAYVGIIMPMLRERGGYYVVYAQAPDVTTLHGRWGEQAFILSRWPTLAAAADFWYCERYQELAIPTRTGHGVFTVLLLPGLAG